MPPASDDNLNITPSKNLNRDFWPSRPSSVFAEKNPLNHAETEKKT